MIYSATVCKNITANLCWNSCKTQQWRSLFIIICKFSDPIIIFLISWKNFIICSSMSSFFKLAATHHAVVRLYILSFAWSANPFRKGDSLYRCLSKIFSLSSCPIFQFCLMIVTTNLLSELIQIGLTRKYALKRSAISNSRQGAAFRTSAV